MMGFQAEYEDGFEDGIEEGGEHIRALLAYIDDLYDQEMICTPPDAVGVARKWLAENAPQRRG